MNVLQIHEKIEIHGGAEVYIRQLTTLLPTYGISTLWIALIKDNDNFKVVSDSNEILFSSFSQLDLRNFFVQFIADNNIDLANIHNLFEKEIVNLLIEILPVIKSVHSPVMVCPGRDKFWRFSERPCTIKYGLHCFYHIYTEGCSNRHPKRVKTAWDYVQFEVNEAASLYKKIIVMSDYMRDGLLECNVSESKILVNPYFTPLVNEEVVNSNQETKRLLFIGRLVSSKGPHIMISALSEILKNNTDIFLDIIGDGLMMEELTTQVKSLGLQSQIIFHGWKNHDEIDTMIRKSYVVLFPSVYPEAFGIVGIEAMMRSKPVVAFNVGGVSTWLKDGETGFLVENKDVESFAKRVQLILNDYETYNRMAIQARINVLKDFIPEVHIKKLIEEYKMALA